MRIYGFIVWDSDWHPSDTLIVAKTKKEALKLLKGWTDSRYDYAGRLGINNIESQVLNSTFSDMFLEE